MKLDKSFKINKKVCNQYFIQYIKKYKRLRTFVDYAKEIIDVLNMFYYKKNNVPTNSAKYLFIFIVYYNIIKIHITTCITRSI